VQQQRRHAIIQLGATAKGQKGTRTYIAEDLEMVRVPLLGSRAESQRRAEVALDHSIALGFPHHCNTCQRDCPPAYRPVLTWTLTTVRRRPKKSVSPAPSRGAVLALFRVLEAERRLAREGTTKGTRTFSKCPRPLCCLLCCLCCHRSGSARRR
jgi:hypothetical protein